ncbi:MAG TPA: S1/P1 nuclease [Bryobacteraceae bacterium]|nr:S1/P1 nuclease [Bryobacteraceae bacterium]
MYAWGCVGHQVVAYIASQNLNASAAAQVNQLLADAQYGSFKRFCDVTNLGKIEYFATWADDARTDANAGWHFWDIPLAVKTASIPQFCDQGCVVTALKEQVGILNSNAARPDKQRALMFVIHLVGDAHQPMHIVDNGDRGGNCVPVSFEYTGFSHKTTEEKGKNGQPSGSYSPNLHSIWDDNIIQTMTGVEQKTNNDQLTQALGDSIAHEYAKQIAANKNVSVDLKKGADFASWALAAHKLAGPNSYDKMPTAIPVDPNPHTLTTCAGVSSRFASLNETAQKDFVKNAQPIVRQQLALAGARLAATLNAIWPAQ